jgi:hypothetical protein
VRWHRPAFRFVDHGHVAPSELAAIYNRCAAGLVLSLTNLSLLPAELLATGCIPVMNEGENTRASFDNPHARFAAPRPDALAAALGTAVEQATAPDGPATLAAAAASVEGRSWQLVSDQIEAGLRRGLKLAGIAPA